jgi:hypothetical protein
MGGKIAICLFVMMITSTLVVAQDGSSQNDKGKADPHVSDAKELSGMSIVGNDEAPKSLYIVPWKSSEIGAETSLNAMLNEADVPVDRDVFRRQLEYYRISTAETKK